MHNCERTAIGVWARHAIGREARVAHEAISRLTNRLPSRRRGISLIEGLLHLVSQKTKNEKSTLSSSIQRTTAAAVPARGSDASERKIERVAMNRSSAMKSSKLSSNKEDQYDARIRSLEKLNNGGDE